MAAFVKIEKFVLGLGAAKHNWPSGNDVLKLLFTNTAPVAATADVTADITQIANGNGYTTGGLTVDNTDYTQTGGTGKLVGDDVVLTATGAVGPFRYIVLVNSTPVGGKLIGYWDNATPVTLAALDTFTVDLDQTNGILTIA